MFAVTAESSFTVCFPQLYLCLHDKTATLAPCKVELHVNMPLALFRRSLTMSSTKTRVTVFVMQRWFQNTTEYLIKKQRASQAFPSLASDGFHYSRSRPPTAQLPPLNLLNSSWCVHLERWPTISLLIDPLTGHGSQHSGAWRYMWL